MRKIISITLLSFLTIVSASAQTSKGTYLLGATQDITSTSWSNISITPSVGYFISDGLAVGMGFSFGNTDDNGDPAGAGQITTSTMTISPFSRYYLDDKFFVSGGVSIGSGNVTTKMDNVDDVSVDVSTFGLNVGAGLSLMWGERVAIEPAFMVMTGSSNTKTGNTTVDGPSSMSAGFSIGLSLRMK